MIALFSLRSVHEELAQEGPDVTQGTSTGRILVFLAYSDSVLAGAPVASNSALSGAIGSFQAFAVGTVAFPVAAGFSNRIRDLSQRGFTRALLLMEIGELPVLVGLVQAFLAVGSL